MYLHNISLGILKLGSTLCIVFSVYSMAMIHLPRLNRFNRKLYFYQRLFEFFSIKILSSDYRTNNFQTTMLCYVDVSHTKRFHISPSATKFDFKLGLLPWSQTISSTFIHLKWSANQVFLSLTANNLQPRINHNTTSSEDDSSIGSIYNFRVHSCGWYIKKRQLNYFRRAVRRWR